MHDNAMQHCIRSSGRFVSQDAWIICIEAESIAHASRKEKADLYSGDKQFRRGHKGDNPWGCYPLQSPSPFASHLSRLTKQLAYGSSQSGDSARAKRWVSGLSFVGSGASPAVQND